MASSVGDGVSDIDDDEEDDEDDDEEDVGNVGIAGGGPINESPKSKRIHEDADDDDELRMSGVNEDEDCEPVVGVIFVGDSSTALVPDADGIIDGSDGDVGAAAKGDTIAKGDAVTRADGSTSSSLNESASRFARNNSNPSNDERRRVRREEFDVASFDDEGDGDEKIEATAGDTDNERRRRLRRRRIDEGVNAEVSIAGAFVDEGIADTEATATPVIS